MEKLALAAVLNRAADYLDAHGLKSRGWGTPGGPVCMNAALAIALDRRWSRAPGASQTTRAVGTVILESGLLDYLPVPDGPPWAPRRCRPAQMDARRAVAELAAWSDAPGRTAEAAASALRAHAVTLARQARAWEPVSATAWERAPVPA